MNMIGLIGRMSRRPLMLKSTLAVVLLFLVTVGGMQRVSAGACGGTVNYSSPHDKSWACQTIYWNDPQDATPANYTDPINTLKVWNGQCNGDYSSVYGKKNMTDRDKVNASSYWLHTWITRAGDANNNSNHKITAGTDLSLQLNQMMFLCGIVTKQAMGLPSPNSALYQSHEVTPSNWPNDRGPVPDGTSVNAASLYQSKTKIKDASYTIRQIVNGTQRGIQQSGNLNASKFPVPALSFTRDDNSRYWRDDTPMPFTINTSPSLLPGEYQIDLTMDYWTLRTYHKADATGDTKCQFYTSSSVYGENVGYNAYTDPRCTTGQAILRYNFWVTPEWTLQGTSLVTTPTDSKTPGVRNSRLDTGETGTLHHWVNNNGPEKATYDWHLEYQINGGNYKNVATSSDCPTVSGSETNSLSGADNPSDLQCKYTFGASASPGDKYCQRIAYTNYQGPGTGTDTSPAACLYYRPSPPVNPHCGMPTFSSDAIEPNVKFDITGGASVKYDTTQEANNAMGSDNFEMRIVLLKNDGTDGPEVSGSSRNIPRNNGPDAYYKMVSDTITGYWPGIGPVNTPGNYRLYWGVVDGTDASYHMECQHDFPVGYLPYFTIKGGDISAGEYTPSSTGNPTRNGNAGIESWNDDNSDGRGNDYYGAGTQAAAYAITNIRSFATSLNPLAALSTSLASRSGTSALQGSGFSPHEFSFANLRPTTFPDDKGNYGGNIGQLPAPADYFDSLSGAATNDWDNTYNKSATYIESGDTVLTSGQLAAGVVINLKVSGNVYIDGPITYDDSGGPGNYPRLNIYTNKNIYIDQSVGEIHGFFVSQDGVFSTCAKNHSESIGFATCSATNLKIYGAVVTKTLHLNRTFGTLHSQSAPAEQFIYSPEFWLSTPDCTVNPDDAECVGVSNKPYNSFTTLPPVL